MSYARKKQQVNPVRILATGSHVPEGRLTNADLEGMVDTSDEWITTRTGIKERRVAKPEQAASDLAEIAARQALEKAGLKASDLDTIIVATVTGDQPFPSTACHLQARLGAKNAFCFDVSAACSGFLYGCEVGRSLIGSGGARTILVVGVEVLSKCIDFQDRNTCVLFGDGAGAAILAIGDDDHHIIATDLGSDGNHTSLIELPAGGSRLPITPDVLDQRLQYMHVKGNEVFKLGVRGMIETCQKTLALAGLTSRDVDLVVPHQANLRIIDAVIKRLEIDPTRVAINIQNYGNTSSASVPIALNEALEEGRLKSGDLLLTVVFGGGLTWGSMLVRW